ncbi:MAG: hypothetical protein ACREE6_10200, partial [Limisphaerales bacterium]
STSISTDLNEDGFVRFQKFLDGFYSIAGIGDAKGVWFTQFVMHQQFANHSHLKICFRHPPDLTGFQRLLAGAASRLDFCHNEHHCASIISLRQWVTQKRHGVVFE